MDPEKAPDDADKILSHTTSSRIAQRTLWIRLLVSCFCLFFFNWSYYSLAGVYTSLNAEIGFVAFGTLYLVWTLCSLFLTPLLLNSVGPRLPVFIGSAMHLLFVALNFYQSWPTLVIAGAAEGLGVGLVWTGILCGVTNIATSLAQVRNASAEKYISMANGLINLSHYASALFGSAVSSAVLLPSQTLLDLPVYHLHVNHSLANMTHGGVPLQNQELPIGSLRVNMNQTAVLGGNATCTESTDAFVVSPWAYYTLVSASFVGSFVSCILSLGLEGKTKAAVCASPKRHDADGGSNCVLKLTSFLKRLQTWITTQYRPVFKSLTRPKYLLPMGISFLGGISQGYFFGTFSRHFISECLGVGVVGLAVIAWAFGSSLFSLVTGKVSPYISRSLVAILTALLQAGMILFMLFWQREPSYPMTFLTSIGWGIVDGGWLILPSIYIGIVAEIEESKAAFGLVKGFFALGGMTSFFVSGYISIEANLWSILVLLIISCMLYIIGEKVFTPTSRPLDYLLKRCSRPAPQPCPTPHLDQHICPGPVITINPLYCDDSEAEVHVQGLFCEDVNSGDSGYIGLAVTAAEDGFVNRNFDSESNQISLETSNSVSSL